MLAVRLVEIMPSMLSANNQTEEFEHILTLHNWMIRWFLFKKTVTEEDIIFMIFVSGLSWNLLRKASLFSETNPNDDEKEEDEIDESYAEHLQFAALKNAAVS